MIAVFFPSVDFSCRTAVNVTASNKFVLLHCHCVFIFLLHSYFASVLWLAKAHDDQIGSLLIKNFKDKMFVFTDQLQTPVLVLLTFIFSEDSERTVPHFNFSTTESIY